jgi:hypothetical protein
MGPYRQEQERWRLLYMQQFIKELLPLLSPSIFLSLIDRAGLCPHLRQPVHPACRACQASNAAKGLIHFGCCVLMRESNLTDIVAFANDLPPAMPTPSVQIGP